ncbi:glutaredoxin domain-containing protein [Cryobacterium sp. PAMC25264]|uniref:glutaredoxin domain-containing protein n=1 Tax=Cryobacterium sp. PAMC25264 TaxID=2861288 RepID=UPI001C636C91|nr:glutaredoxin domain-containing protein [Cryobacterium sp. PAMC25264]QYF72288.1 glutathione S-transferase N-terminal domain-containing protein [Cryobacterium sp. PAMC25264]
MTAPATPAAAAAADLTMFGAEWCKDCRRSKKLLDGLGVAYDYVDLESVEDGADRARAISGRTQIPVLVFADNTHMVEPSDADVRAKLTALGTI